MCKRSFSACAKIANVIWWAPFGVSTLFRKMEAFPSSWEEWQEVVQPMLEGINRYATTCSLYHTAYLDALSCGGR